MCDCKKKQLDVDVYVDLFHKMKELNPRIAEQKLEEAAFEILDLVKTRHEYDKKSRHQIDSLVADVLKRRKFYEARTRRNGKKWNSV